MLEASLGVYSRGWCALDGRNRPYTARDMPVSVNDALMTHCNISGLSCLLNRVCLFAKKYTNPSKILFEGECRCPSLSTSIVPDGKIQFDQAAAFSF